MGFFFWTHHKLESLSLTPGEKVGPAPSQEAGIVGWGRSVLEQQFFLHDTCWQVKTWELHMAQTQLPACPV